MPTSQGTRWSPYRAGFELHPIVRRAAIATGGKWRDVLVAEVRLDGRIVIADPFDGATIDLWHYLDLTEALAVGDPVAYHPQYGVLTWGGKYVSVSRIAD